LFPAIGGGIVVGQSRRTLLDLLALSLDGRAAAILAPMLAVPQFPYAGRPRLELHFRVPEFRRQVS
jgi:hypothetical protein